MVSRKGMPSLHKTGMMEVTELRIGSKVWYECDDMCMTTEATVMAIEHFGEYPNGKGPIFQAKMLNQYGETVHENVIDLEPIPFTEEWRKRCGFEGFHVEIPTTRPDRHEDNCILTITDKGCSLLGETGESEIELRKPDFVHEVQNLYRDLAGKELEIKNL